MVLLASQLVHRSHAAHALLLPLRLGISIQLCRLKSLVNQQQPTCVIWLRNSTVEYPVLTMY